MAVSVGFVHACTEFCTNMLGHTSEMQYLPWQQDLYYDMYKVVSDQWNQARARWEREKWNRKKIKYNVHMKCSSSHRNIASQRPIMCNFIHWNRLCLVFVCMWNHIIPIYLLYWKSIKFSRCNSIRRSLFHIYANFQKRSKANSMVMCSANESCVRKSSSCRLIAYFQPKILSMALTSKLFIHFQFD